MCRFFILLIILAAGAYGQGQIFTVDSPASTVGFSLGASLHVVHGVFRVQSGSIDFDPVTSRISGSVVVGAASGNSGDDSRDKKMKRDVLDVARSAEISFVPQSYQGDLSLNGDSKIQVSGTFTLRGTPHQLTVPMQVHVAGAHCTAKARFVVPYVAWGLKDPSTFILRVAKEVNIDLSIVGTLQKH